MKPEQLIHSIRSDANLPHQVKSDVLNLIRSVEEGEDLLQDIRSTIFSPAGRGRFMLRGPKLDVPPENQFARVMTANTFQKYLGLGFRGSSLFDRNSHEIPVRDLINSGLIDESCVPKLFQSSLPGVAWVAFSEDLKDIDADRLVFELGLTHLHLGEDLILVTYRLPKGTVHIPTVLDALLDPSFVAKPQGTSTPRAWNWEKNDWGFREVVHSRADAVKTPDFRWVGPLSRDPVLYSLKYIERNFVDQIVKIARPHIVDTSDRLFRSLCENPKLMYEISPRDFERVIAELLSDMGWSVELTPPAKDGGFDALALQQTELGPILCLVEAKRYRRDRKVGVELVRSLYGTMEDKGASTSLLVTTSAFTSGAQKFQSRNKYRISLREHSDIVKWLKKYGRNRW